MVKYRNPGAGSLSHEVLYGKQISLHEKVSNEQHEFPDSVYQSMVTHKQSELVNLMNQRIDTIAISLLEFKGCFRDKNYDEVSE